MLEHAKLSCPYLALPCCEWRTVTDKYEQLEFDFDYAEEQYRKMVADELTRLSQEMGMYDEPA